MKRTKQKGQPRTLRVTRPAFERDYTTPLSDSMQNLEAAALRIKELTKLDFDTLRLSSDQKADLLAMYQNEKI